jgi:hypothetical protein
MRIYASCEQEFSERWMGMLWILPACRSISFFIIIP